MGELCGYIVGYAYDTPAFADGIRLATELDMVVQIHDDSATDIARLLAGFPNLYLDISGHGYQRMGVLELAVQQAGSERVLVVSDYTLARSYILRMRLIEITEKLLLRLRTKLLFICFSDRIIWYFSGRS